MALDSNLRKILQTQQHAIASSVQLQHLLPILREKDLVTDPEFGSLAALSAESNYDRNTRMVSIILQKGKSAFDLFVKALQSEEHHIGHKSLAETLQAAKKELRKPSLPSRTMFFTPPCPRTRRLTQQPPTLVLSQVKPRRRSSRPKSTGTSTGTDHERQPADELDKSSDNQVSIALNLTSE